MIVYRVEDEAGGGPYRGGKWEDLLGVLASNPTYSHPTPADDGISIYGTRGWHCAFASIEQAKAWFDDTEREAMADRGFQLSVYDAPKVKAGAHQVMFDPEPARFVEQRDLADI